MGRIKDEKGNILVESIAALNESLTEGCWLMQESTGYMGFEVNESSKGPGPLKFRGKFQEANAVNKNRRMYPHDILESNVRRLVDAVNNRGLLGELDHPCLTDNDFRVLTKTGWKEFKDVKIGDTVYSRVDGVMVESRVNNIIDEPYDGSAYHVKGRNIDCEFTPGHRFLMLPRQDHNESDKEVYETIREIYTHRTSYSKYRIPKTAKWTAESTEFVVPGYKGDRKSKATEDLHFDAEKFASFLGIYLAEGTLPGTGFRVEICQKCEYGRALIKPLLKSLHPELEWQETPSGFALHDARLRTYLEPLGNMYTKYIPEEIKNLSAKCLDKLMFWYAVGDGRILKLNGAVCENMKESEIDEAIDQGVNTRMSVFTVSQRLIRDLHECLVKAGHSGSLTKIDPENDYVYAGHVVKAEDKQPLYNLAIHRSKNIHLDKRFLEINEVHHKGNIYCLSVDHGNFYMEHKGKSFWTGNSDSIIHFENASHLVTKLWWEKNTLMGEGEVLDTPSGKLLKSLINSGVRVGISSRGVGNGTTNEDGVLVIGESYKLITFDAVADPSTFSAFQKKVVAGVQENVNHAQKNEGSRINNSKAWIAFLGCLFENKTKEIKERLHS